MEAGLNDAPRISLIVATVGRTTEVSSLLRSIPIRNRPHVEVIVVDQNEIPLEKELLVSSAPLNLVHLRTCVRNASAARNLGAMRAQAQWLMFPDDDATFEADALDQILLLIGRAPYELISGQIVNSEGAPHLLEWLSHPTEITPETLDYTFVESAFVIQRDVFKSVNGFDPLFGPGSPLHSAEGADLVRRLWRRGVLRAWFTPAFALQHPEKRSMLTAAARQRIRDFAVGEGALTARHCYQLPMLHIGKKLLFRVAGTLITSGEKRKRKIAFLAGFSTGVFKYVRLQRAASRLARSRGRT